jgi:hypothetical protein
MIGLVTSWTVSLVVQPSSMIMTCQRQFFGVTPPSQDGFPIEGDFATCFVEKYLTPCIAQDSNGEEIVDKVGELMS